MNWRLKLNIGLRAGNSYVLQIWFSPPGIPRETEEEKDFADFDLFDDPERPYSTFNFKYTNKSFDRLTKLTEFNTLMYKDLILEQVKHCIKVRRRHSIRRPIKLKDIKKLGLKDKHKVEKLEAFIRSLDQEEPPICWGGCSYSRLFSFLAIDFIQGSDCI